MWSVPTPDALIHPSHTHRPTSELYSRSEIFRVQINILFSPHFGLLLRSEQFRFTLIQESSVLCSYFLANSKRFVRFFHSPRIFFLETLPWLSSLWQVFLIVQVETLTPFFSNSLAILGKLSLGTFLMLRIIKRLSCGLRISGLPLLGRIFTDFMFPYLSMMDWMVDRGRPTTLVISDNDNFNFWYFTSWLWTLILMFHSSGVVSFCFLPIFGLFTPLLSTLPNSILSYASKTQLLLDKGRRSWGTVRLFTC